MDNPLEDVGFEIPFDRIRAEHVEPAIDALLERARQRVDAIAETDESPRWETTLGALEDATEPLERAMGVVEHLESVATTPALREAYNAVQPKVSAFFSKIPLHEGLWNRLTSYSGTDEAAGLDATRRRLLDKTLDDFRRHGADLDARGKERLSEIDVELSQMTNRFAQNLLDATNAFELLVQDEDDLAGLPASARDAARQSARDKGVEGWRFTLQQPSVVAVLTYMDDATIRERIWRALMTRATSGEADNRPLIGRTLQLRQEKAELLGYANFPDLVLEDRMAKDAHSARAFVDDLREQTRNHFERENAELADFRGRLEGPNAPELAPWDVPYYAEKQRKALFEFDEEELRPYFHADRVLDGLFEIAQRLFGIRIEAHPMPVWDDQVQSYAVYDEDGTMLGAFYVDLFPRENKRGGAWMNSLITGVTDTDGRTAAPHLALLCANVSPPTQGGPARLSHSEVETLFHEFGHLMHQLLSRVSVRSLAGANVAWDFVELPSQLMENFTWEREALDLFARHEETDETIPEALYNRLRRTRTYRAANAMMRQIGLATVDLALHVDYEPERDGDAMEYARGILQEHAATRLPHDYAMIAGFHHLFGYPVGYAGGYYSYKWAEVLDADAFRRFKSEGVFNPRVGRAFRECILSKGDSEDPMALFEGFLGRKPTIDALLERSGLIRPAA